MMRPRPFDYLAIALSLGVLIAVSVYSYGGHHQASQISIETDSGRFIYPLDRDRVVEVEGPIGITVVTIADGTVSVSESPCRDKICIAAGELNRAGQWTACLPNRVFIRVEGDDSGEIDGQTY